MEFKSGEWCGFPYAVKLAEERGATRILIQPRIRDESITGEIRPDVFALMPSGPPLIIEVEDSTGQKFKKDGPRHRESSLRGKVNFTFILGPGARGCKKILKEYFGESVELIELADLETQFGELHIGSKPVPVEPVPDAAQYLLAAQR